MTALEPGSRQSESFKTMERRLLKAIINPAMIATWVLETHEVRELRPRYRRSAPHRRPPGTAAPDTRSIRLSADRSACRRSPDSLAPSVAQVLGPRCRVRPPCRWQPSRVRRKIRSAPRSGAAPALRAEWSRTPARARLGRVPRAIARPMRNRREVQAAAPRRCRTQPAGRAPAGSPECPRRRSPHRSRTGAPAARLPRPQAWVGNRVPEIRPPVYAAPDIPANTFRPGASARSVGWAVLCHPAPREGVLPAWSRSRRLPAINLLRLLFFSF